MLIKGRYRQPMIENILIKYISKIFFYDYFLGEYVACHACRSFDTTLVKDKRLLFLECKTCGSRSSVACIKTGFTALTEKRAVLRRAAGENEQK